MRARHVTSRTRLQLGVLSDASSTSLRKARQNGENVNPFGAIASVAGDRSGPWTGWIGPAPV